MENPQSRDDDYLLYNLVCKACDIDTSTIAFDEALLNRKELGIPNWESVSRYRRKLQEINPELRRNAYSKRQKRQEEFKAYARA